VDPVIVYHYAGCSTCKSALAWLRQRQIPVELRPIAEAPPGVDELRRAAQAVPWRKLFNISGQSYRAGGWKDRLPGMTEEEALTALSADGMLIKRPLALLPGGAALVGYDEARWAAAFAGQP
jgi:arsenate reductase